MSSWISGALLAAAACAHVQPMPALDLAALQAPPLTAPGPAFSDTVDTRPALIHNGRLDFPPSALRAGLQGWVVIDAIVGIDGRPEPGSVRAAALSDSVFVAAAVRSIELAIFSPGTKHGAPVRVLVRVPVVFRIGRH